MLFLMTLLEGFTGDFNCIHIEWKDCNAKIVFSTLVEIVFLFVFWTKIFSHL